MEYSISGLSRLTGVSARTLRYYDEFGLLVPCRVNSNGYRIYGSREVNLLQQILFYRELGMALEEIKKIVLSADFDGITSLSNHLTALYSKREQLNLLIANVEKTISASKGEVTMSDKEKFSGFKQKALQENEEKYGKEIREKYGDSTVDASNNKFKNMTQEQYEEVEKISNELHEKLKTAFEQGDPTSALAQEVCELHKNWLCYFWTHYSKEAHIGVTQMYVDDPRFTEHYDKIAVGSAVFLRDAVKHYCRGNS